MNNSLQSIHTDQCSSHAFLVVAQLETVVSQQWWCLFAADPLAGPSLAEDTLAEDTLAEDILAESWGTLAACHREGTLPLQVPPYYIPLQAFPTCFRDA